MRSAIEALDWPKVINITAEYARSQMGKLLVEKLLDEENWASTCERARSKQEHFREVQPLTNNDSIWSALDGLEELTESLEKLKKDGVLDLRSHYQIFRWCIAFEVWLNLPRELNLGPAMKKLQASLFDPFTLLRSYNRVIQADGTLKDDASPLLSELNRKLRGIQKRVDQEMEALQRRYQSLEVLQESYIDQRNSRPVFLVKVSEQSRVKGRIHEYSSSGQSVFIEPSEIESLFIEKTQIENEISEEVFRILQELSSEVAPHSSDIEQSHRDLAYWDSVYAKNRFGENFSGRSIEVTDDYSWKFEHSAHPLLWWSLSNSEIIRNDLTIDSDQRALLITGPNTGGKTVLLKMMGYAALAARTGFPMSGATSARVPFIDSVFADLGDVQSIEEHLSSFSGHIVRINDAIENMTDQSLILLDELNSATDPEEGSALARAFLDHVLENSHAMIVATTHDPLLKAWSANEERILAASMEFDDQALSPTYKMVTGFPGRSRAIEVAKKLGVNRSVIEKAEEFLSQSHRQFEKVMEQMETELKKVQTERQEVRALRDQAARLEKKWREKSGQAITDLVEQSRKKLRQIVLQTQDEARKAIQSQQVKKSLDRAIDSAAGKIQDYVEEAAPELTEEVQSFFSQKDKQAAESTFEVDQFVRVPKWKSLGVIEEIKGKNAKVNLRGTQLFGPKKMTISIPLNDIYPLSEEELEKQKVTRPSGRTDTGGVSLQLSANNEFSSSTLDLRGERFEEGMARLERYLDFAFQEGYSEVTIVHGLGTGALKDGTKQVLSKSGYVKSFRDGGEGRGGYGATLVEFDRD